MESLSTITKSTVQSGLVTFAAAVQMRDSSRGHIGSEVTPMSTAITTPVTVEQFMRSAPELVVEVLSPSNTVTALKNTAVFVLRTVHKHF
jgi:hypothetical protein